MFERFENVMYGDYASSFDSKTPLAGKCYCVGDVEDEEGLNWRSFTPEHWEQVKHLTNEEIIYRYPAALYRY